MCAFVQHDDQGNLLKKKGIKYICIPQFNRLETRYHLILLENKKYFVYVGSLNKRKGFAEFYDLVKKLPRSHSRSSDNLGMKRAHCFLLRLVLQKLQTSWSLKP